MARERNQIFGGLSKKQVHSLPEEVREARAAYIADSGQQIDGLFAEGVTELPSDSPHKTNWAETRRARIPIVSLDQLVTLGYQIDQDGHTYKPWERN